MMPFSHRFLNRFGCAALILLLCTLSVSLFFAWKPVFRGFFGEDRLFYGTVRRVAVSSVWGGSDVPLFDKVHIGINGDGTQDFLLVLSKDQKRDMADWFRWLDPLTGKETAMEIHAKRAGDNTWLVNEIDTSEGYLDSGSVHEFLMRACFWAVLLNLFLLIAAYRALREYYCYFRHRPWFAIGEKKNAAAG